MISKLTLLGKVLVMTTLIAYVITFLPWGSFCLKLSYLGLTTGLLIIRSFAYTWDDLCLFLYIMGLVTFISVVKTYYFNHDIRKNVNKKLIKGERD